MVHYIKTKIQSQNERIPETFVPRSSYKIQLQAKSLNIFVIARSIDLEIFSNFRNYKKMSKTPLNVESLQSVIRAVICCGDMCTIVPPTGELELETIEDSKVYVNIYFLDENAQLFLVDLCSGNCASFSIKAFF